METAPSEPTRTSRRSWTSRTSLITTVAIGCVLVAGSAAVATNIGILNAADNSTIGDLAATDELLPAPNADGDTAVVSADTAELAPLTTTASTAVGSAGPQEYVVDSAGTLGLITTSDGLALDHATPQAGWTVALSQTDPKALQLTFVSDTRTVVFTASLGADGSIVADLTEPAAQSAPAVTTPSISPSNTPSTPTSPSRPIAATPSATTTTPTYTDDDHSSSSGSKSGSSHEGAHDDD